MPRTISQHPTTVETQTRERLTGYQLLARDVMEALDTLLAEVPKLEARERKSRAFIRTHIGVPPDFVIFTARGVEDHPDLDRMNQMNLAAAWAARQLAEAFRPVVQKLIVTTNELQTLLDTREANAAAEALKMYAIIRTLARRKADTRMNHLLTILKRELGRRGRPRKRKATAAARPKKRPLRRKKPRPLSARLERRVKR